MKPLFVAASFFLAAAFAQADAPKKAPAKSPYQPILCAAYKPCAKKSPCGQHEMCVSAPQCGAKTTICMADPCKDMCGAESGKCAVAPGFPSKIVCDKPKK